MLDLDRPHAAEDRARRLVTVADDQAATGLVAVLAMCVDVLGHLVLDRLLQRPAGAVAGDLFERGVNDRLGCKPEGKLG
jgi:hypothetical protein